MFCSVVVVKVSFVIRDTGFCIGPRTKSLIESFFVVPKVLLSHGCCSQSSVISDLGFLHRTKDGVSSHFISLLGDEVGEPTLRSSCCCFLIVQMLCSSSLAQVDTGAVLGIPPGEI